MSALPAATEEGPLALVCGGGSLPLAVADFVAARGRKALGMDEGQDLRGIAGRETAEPRLRGTHRGIAEQQKILAIPPRHIGVVPGREAEMVDRQIALRMEMLRPVAGPLLVEMTRPALRLMRSSSVASTSGSPVSQPSESTMTIVRRSTRCDQRRLNSASDSPMRVPPPQQTSARRIRSSACRASRAPSMRVTLLICVPNRKVRTSWHRLRAWKKCSNTET